MTASGAQKQRKNGAKHANAQNSFKRARISYCRPFLGALKCGVSLSAVDSLQYSDDEANSNSSSSRLNTAAARVTLPRASSSSSTARNKKKRALAATDAAAVAPHAAAAQKTHDADCNAAEMGVRCVCPLARKEESSLDDSCSFASAGKQNMLFVFFVHFFSASFELFFWRDFRIAYNLRRPF